MCSFFRFFCDETFGKDTAFKFANIQLDSLYAIAKRHPGKLTIVANPKEMFRAVKQKKLAGLIGVEGGHMVEDNMLYLDSLFVRGARYLTLTWNNSTSWASSAADESDNNFNGKKGLNEFGRSIVERMNTLGMMIDLSHTGEQTFRDVMATTTKPVIVSHSSVYALSPHYRNLKDEQIRAIAKNRGVIQVNFYPLFLDSNYIRRIQPYILRHRTEIDSLQKLNWSSSFIGSLFRQKYQHELQDLLPPIEAVLDHIDYIVKVAGVDHVGLGSDFDGIPYAPNGLEDVAQFPNITKGLLERGYRKRDIRKILGGNLIRVFRNNSK